jgi:hypothetical protein
MIYPPTWVPCAARIGKINLGAFLCNLNPDSSLLAIRLMALNQRVCCSAGWQTFRVGDHIEEAGH